MGFSLSRSLKGGLKLFDKATLGIVSGGLANTGSLGDKLLKAAGLKPGDVPNLGDVQNEAELREKIKLAALEKEKREEAKFMSTEGQGIRRQATLSFGDDSDGQSAEVKSVASTGRFDTNRLVL